MPWPPSTSAPPNAAWSTTCNTTNAPHQPAAVGRGNEDRGLWSVKHRRPSCVLMYNVLDVSQRHQVGRVVGDPMQQRVPLKIESQSITTPIHPGSACAWVGSVTAVHAGSRAPGRVRGASVAFTAVQHPSQNPESAPHLVKLAHEHPAKLLLGQPCTQRTADLSTIASSWMEPPFDDAPEPSSSPEP